MINLQKLLSEIIPQKTAASEKDENVAVKVFFEDIKKTEKIVVHAGGRQPKDEIDMDLENEYIPMLLYCEVPTTVLLQKRHFIEEQCKKYNIEREKSCEIL